MKFKVYNAKLNLKKQLPIITVHGRFQPPLHINHWKYINTAFGLAKKVRILITNPYLKDRATNIALHRGKAENNPFTYPQRIKIFRAFFKNKGIPSSRYEFKPFEITNKKSWLKILNKKVPNLVSTYGSPWSKQKFVDFKNFGVPVVRINLKRVKGFSGTKIRKILDQRLSPKRLKIALVRAGLMPEAVDGLLRELK
ncbi:MAG TPA: hypothetical protein VE973_02160 [Candidatus Limnocylindria bacterium]|nr:hypothetical protein [Candidatus Limnocylindria bacterium]